MKGKKRAERLAPRLDRLYQVLKNAKFLFKTETPAMREILEELELDLDKLSRVHGDLNTLVDLGLVEHLPIPTRCFRATGPAPDQINWEELLLASS